VNPGFFKALRTGVSLEDLEDPRARELFMLLEEWYRKTGGGPSGALGALNAAGSGELLEMVQDKELQEYILQQEASGAFSSVEKLLSDGITKIKSKVLERRRREIIRELRSPALEAVRQGDLLAEKIHIDGALTRLKERSRVQASGASPVKSKEGR
jgi:DNA primase